MTEPSDKSTHGEAEPQTLAEAMTRLKESGLRDAELVEPHRSVEEAPGALPPRGDE
jgi:hypothetical protein